MLDINWGDVENVLKLCIPPPLAAVILSITPRMASWPVT